MTKTICEFLGAWVLLSIIVSLFLGRALKSAGERDTLSLDTTEEGERA